MTDTSWRPPGEIDAPPVVLRRFHGDETEALVTAVSASRDHLVPWMAWASVEPIEANLRNYIDRAVVQFGDGTDFNYALWDGAEVVGGSGLHRRLGPGRLEIGYWVRQGWLRRGIATAAAGVLTAAAFTDPGVDEVWIMCDEANVASASVPRRLGFRLVGVVDHQVTAPAEAGRHLQWAVDRAGWGGRDR